jgi:hypothetical protein
VQNVEERKARVDLDNTRQITYGLGIVFLAVIRLRTEIVPRSQEMLVLRFAEVCDGALVVDRPGQPRRPCSAG